MSMWSCASLLRVAALFVCAWTPVAAQQQRLDPIESGIALDPQGVLEAEPSRFYISSFWRQNGAELARFSQDVLRSDNGGARLTLARGWWLSFLMWLNIPVGSVDLWSAEELGEFARHLLPSGLSAEEAHRLVAEVHAGMARVLDELPVWISEEYARRGDGTEGSLLSAFGPAADREENVLWLLLAVVRIQQYMGSEDARLAAGAVLHETNPRLAGKEELQGGRAPGLRYSFGQMLDGIPEAKHPVVGRELDARVRSVVVGLLESGEEMFREMAWLLADERPLREDTVEAVYGAQCGVQEEECEVYLSRLYSGPDDRALEVLRSRVDERVRTGLARQRKERRSGCEELSALAGSAAVGVPSWAFEETIRRVEEEISSSTRRITRLLDVAERIDELTPEVLDAVFEYWSAERDGQAQAILEREGLLTRSLEEEATLPARGDCLADRFGGRW